MKLKSLTDETEDEVELAKESGISTLFPNKRLEYNFSLQTLKTTFSHLVTSLIGDKEVLWLER